MSTIKEIDDQIGSLKHRYKTELEISKFFMMRADAQLENLKLRQPSDRIEENDKKFQEDIVQIKKSLKDALYSALKVRSKIKVALALLEKSKLSIEASDERAENIFTIPNAEVTKQWQARLKKIKQVAREKDISISCSVYEVIRKSMTSYYFDKIGDSLLARTKNPDNFNLSEFKILVSSYNKHVYIPVDITELI